MPIASIEPCRKISRWKARGAAGLAVLFLTTWFGYLYGFDTIPLPFLAHKIGPSLNKETRLSDRLGPGIPNTNYYYLSHPQEFRLVDFLPHYSESIEVGIYGLGNLDSFDWNGKILLEPGSRYISITLDKESQHPGIIVPSFIPDVGLEVFRVKNLEKSVSFSQPGAYFAAVCPMRLKKRPDDPDNPVWEGSIASQLEGYDPGKSRSISVYIAGNHRLSRTVKKELAKAINEIEGKGLSKEDIYLNRTLHVADSPAYEGESVRGIWFQFVKTPMYIGKPIGQIKPDESGAWRLDLTMSQDENSFVRLPTVQTSHPKSISLVVIFQVGESSGD